MNPKYNPLCICFPAYPRNSYHGFKAMARDISNFFGNYFWRQILKKDIKIYFSSASLWAEGQKYSDQP